MNKMEPESMRVLLFFIDVDENELFENYTSYLECISLEKKEQINHFRFDIDKKLSLLSDLVVRYVACVILNLRNDELVFGKNKFGKPFLAGYPNFHYNIAHTRNAIAICISKMEVGVDIEKIENANFLVADRFFSKEEKHHIFSNNKDPNKCFFEIWTKKESYIKWIGKGFSMPLTMFDTMDKETSRLFSVFNLRDYIVSVCGNGISNNIEILELSEKQILKVIEEFLI